MPDKTTWLIGSAPDCDLVVDRPSVSWNHCRLTRVDDGYLLEDLNSTNGTFVNGLRMLAPARVTPADEVTLGLTIPLPWPEAPLPPDEPHSGPQGKQVFRVGRDSDNDVVIDHPEVSGLHARVLVSPGRDRGDVEDLGSTNGTSLNAPGNPVTHTAFARGDTLYFGPVAVPAARFLDGAVSAAVPVPAPVVEMVDGIPILRFDGAPITLGRDPACERVVDLPVVSFRHAKLYRSGQDLVIEDLRSSNGTFVNGRRVLVPTVVRPGDLIGLGAHTLRLAGGEADLGRSAAGSIVVPVARKPDAATAIPARLALGFGLVLQPMILAAVIVVASGWSAPVEDQARVTHILTVSLFGLSVGAVWLGLFVSAVDHLFLGMRNGGPTGTSAILNEMAVSIALGGAALMVLCGLTFGLVSMRVTFEGDSVVTTLFMTLASLTGFVLGRVLIRLTGRLGVAAAVAIMLMLVMSMLAGPIAPAPKVSPPLRWVAEMLPSRWSFEGLLLIHPGNLKENGAGATGDRAEPFFPAESERMGLTACVTALALMAIGLAYTDALIALAIGGRGRNPADRSPV